MKKLYVLLAIGSAMVPAAHAAEEARALHPLIGLGVTFGGATLANVHYADGSSSSIHAGGLIDVYGGVDYRAGSALSVQATAGYHVDNRSASNGSLRFGRYPVELLAYYNLAEHWRAGGGVRFVMNPHVSGSGVAGGADLRFRSTTGAIVEGEYLLSRTGWAQFGFKLRYVVEQYQPRSGGASVSGNHVGIFSSLYF
jgi:hypothetical protein